MEENDKNLLQTYALLSRAAARKKIYSLKALKEDKPRTAHLLRALSESEAAQARRILNMIRGKIDPTENYLATVFTKEIQEILARYTEEIKQAKALGLTTVANALSQLFDAERRLTTFYAYDVQDIRVAEDDRYHVCQFCGFVGRSQPPDICPVCGAKKETFMEIQ
ncbi:MAG: rubrerythrin family protein [Desulfurivibrio sp.]|jgi:rubrerythrin|nr:MAG: rubrerythrin family protein [Desulfurivibrio sp.]